VSARSEQAAADSCIRLADRLTAEPSLDLGDVAYTLQVGRKVFNHRAVVVADSTAGAAARLTDPTKRLSRKDATIGRRTGYLIAGVGEQYPGMVAALYTDEPTFRADVDECLDILGVGEAAELSDMFVATGDGPDDGAGDLAALLGRVRNGSDGRAGNGAPSTGDAQLVQPAVFVAEYALARQLVRWGIQPEILIGYSLGEYVAACLSGVLSLADALRLVAHRAKLISALPEGAMLAVAADERRLKAILVDQLAGDLDVAIRTGTQIVLAGPHDTVDTAASRLLAAGIGCRRLATTHAYHSRMLAPAAAELTQWVADNITVHPPAIPYLSNVTGEPVTKELVADPSYWARHMCETVAFGAGLEHVLASGDLALVEIGPGQSLGALTRGHSKCQQSQWPLIVTTLPAAADRRDAHATLAETVGRLWLTGVTVDWAAWHGGADPGTPDAWAPGRVPLPTYPFERQDYWLEADAPAQSTDGAPAFDESDPSSILTGLPRLPDTRWINLPVWQQTTPRPARADARRWLVFTDIGFADTIAASLRAHLEAAGAQVVLARPGERFATGPDGVVLRPGSPEDAGAALRHLAGRDLTPERVVHLWTAGGDGTDAVQRGFLSLVALARAAGDLGLRDWSLDVVATGSHLVHPGDRVRPEVATALGPVRLIPVEYPGVRTRLIDVDSATTGPALRALLTELRAEPDDQVVALRGARRWTPGYEVLDAARIADAPHAVRIRRGGTYLVTGGLGGIGLAMAERLAVDYRARLVLFGRTPVPPRDQWSQILSAAATAPEVRRRLEGLRRLEAAGAEVVTVAGDASRVEDVRRAVATAVDRFGELTGVLHCAGVPAVGLMQFKTATDIEKVLAPKVAGTRALAEVLREVPVDFMALFSSTTSATGGGAGQVDYCAANAFLDAFAQSDPLPGRIVTSIDWGEWIWNGWTSGLDNYDEGSRNFFEEYRQTFGIPFDEGWQVLQRVLASGEPHVVVSTQDFAPIVAMSRRASIESHQATVKKARDALGNHPRPDLSTAYVEPQSPTEEAIAGVWREALGLEEVGVHDNFFELGGNSLIGMEIIAQVRTVLGLSYLPPHILYQAPTIASLADAAREESNDQQDQPTAGARDKSRSRIEQRRSTLRSGRMS
jgi:acyl transferase domain-containing protein